MTGSARKSRITVVLPVYNGEKYLAEAIESVLSQSFTDFELLVIDDGSSDRTPDILAGFADGRLRIMRLPENRGLIAALNTGIAESQSELIARMDADDVCLPRRFERQVALLDAQPETALCGTWAEEFGARSIVYRLPTRPEEVGAGLFFGFVMYHPTLMMRRAFLEKHALAYREGFSHVEDFDFLIRAAEFGALANVPEVLLRYRVHNRQVTALHGRELTEATEGLLAHQLRLLLPEANRAEVAFHMLVNRELVPESALRQAGQWLLRLRAANRKKARYDRDAFENELRQKWHRIFGIYEEIGWWSPTVLLSYWTSPLSWIPGADWRRQKTRFDECLDPPARRAGWTLR